jgi:DNA repair exonuclease SbcCD ATPase subunit
VEYKERDYDIAKETRRRLKRELEESRAHLEAATEAAFVIQTVASNVQQMWYENLGRIVSKCLAAVFDNPYQFKLVFTKQASRTQIKFMLERDFEDFDPISSTGGGVVDVCAFALRIAALMLSVQGQRKIIIADEPFRFVSSDLQPRMRELLERLAEEFDVQLLMVTHEEEFEVGKVHLIK